MRKKSHGSGGESGKTKPSSDTASYQQPQGDPKVKPERRYEKLPHERDESAKSTGNRLDEPRPPPDTQISRAEKDVTQGRVDTDRRGVPSDVPGPRTRRER